jgi:hypothetical protein
LVRRTERRATNTIFEEYKRENGELASRRMVVDGNRFTYEVDGLFPANAKGGAGELSGDPWNWSSWTASAKGDAEDEESGSVDYVVETKRTPTGFQTDEWRKSSRTTRWVMELHRLAIEDCANAFSE